jgi:hypothetical protein
MYALQRPQCDPRNKLPQMRLQELAPQEQRAKSLIDIFNIFLSLFGLISGKQIIIKTGIKVTMTFMHV